MDWNETFITDWQEVAPEFPEPVSDSDRAVEPWEEEFMDAAQPEYDRVPAEVYWARYGNPHAK